MDGHKLSDKIETDCLGVILKKKKKNKPDVFQKANRSDKSRLYSE